MGLIWHISLRIILISALFFSVFFVWNNDYIFSSILLFFVVLGFIVELIFFLQKQQTEHQKIVLSMLKNDYSLRLKPKKNKLHNQLVSLYEQQKQEHYNWRSYQTLFENILNELEVGILILEKESNQNWQVFYTNPRFLNIIDLPKYKDWSVYKARIPNLIELLEELDYQNANQSIELQLNENEKSNYALRSNRINMQEKAYFILALDAIQNIIERKEKQAYYNLMKVISHELLNTLTPVHSLLQDLQDYTVQENPTKEDKEELTHSLEMIERKSNHLLSFVNNYRLIGQLPTPKKQPLSVKNLIESTIELLKQELIQENIVPILELEEFTIQADLEMMERVMINLISNSVNALRETKNKELKIKSYRTENKIHIEIVDNGIGIPNEIKDKVFIPFFTTRQNGGGIGLTLAKSIIDAHNGWVTFQSDENKTEFKISLKI